MRSANRVISVGWGVLGLLIVVMGVIRVVLPQQDDLGMGVVVVASFAAGLGIAAVVMLVGVAMGVHALLTLPQARTPMGFTATGGTLIALTLIVYFVARLVST